MRACPLARVLGPRGAPARLGLLEAAFRTPAGRREASGAAGDTGRTQEEPPRPPCRAYRHRVPGEAVFRASGAVGAEGALPLSPPQSLPTRVSAALRGRGSSGSGGVKSKRGLSAGPRPPLLSNPLGGRAGAGGSSVVQTPLTLENAARCPLLSLGPPRGTYGAQCSRRAPRGGVGGWGAGSTHPVPTRGPGRLRIGGRGAGWGARRLCHDVFVEVVERQEQLRWGGPVGTGCSWSQASLASAPGAAKLRADTLPRWPCGWPPRCPARPLARVDVCTVPGCTGPCPERTLSSCPGRSGIKEQQKSYRLESVHPPEKPSTKENQPGSRTYSLLLKPCNQADELNK